MTTETLRLAAHGGYWTTSWYDGRGKRRWKRFGNVTTVDRTAAYKLFRGFYEKWMRDTVARGQGDGSDVTVRTLAEEYLLWADGYYRKPTGRPTGETANLRDAMNTALELFGDKPTSEVIPADLKACQTAMIDDGLARKTINSRINRIRRVFRWGTENNFVRPEVWWGLKAVSSLKHGRTPARETEPVKPVPDKAFWLVHAMLPGPVQAMIELQLLTGMRPGEVRTMRPVDIDTSGAIWTYTPQEHKTEHHGRSRRIYMGPKAQKIVKPFLKRKRSVTTYLFDPREAMCERYAKRQTHRHQPTAEPKTDRKVGDHYTQNSYAQAISYACEKAGISRWTPNQLRHSCATRLRKEYGVEAARVILGHAKLETTEIYAEIDEKKSRDIMKRVG